MKYKTKIVKIGNSKGVIIPAFFFKDIDNPELDFDVTENGKFRTGILILKAKVNPKPKMKERSF